MQPGEAVDQLALEPGLAARLEREHLGLLALPGQNAQGAAGSDVGQVRRRDDAGEKDGARRGPDGVTRRDPPSYIGPSIVIPLMVSIRGWRKEHDDDRRGAPHLARRLS